ncbi:MAG: FAD-binding oxidoreductase, partial [Natronomonas sp.]|nr:FAD-binding oxidoreductase [Natronomonas sp.]
RTAHLGRLEIARSTVEDRRLRERERAAKDRLATPTEYVAGPDLDRSLLVPDLRTAAIEGAIYRANMACFQPRPMARLLAERASAAGVRFEDGTAVTDLVTESGSVVGVETDSERIEADHVVCAAGPWVSAFARSVDLDLPARHTLGPMLRVRPAEPIAERLPSLKDHDSGVYLRRDFDGTILVGHRPGGYEVGTVYEVEDVPDRVPEDRRDKMLTAATDLVPALADAETVEEWVGVRTLTDDGVPIVDTNAVDGLSLTVMNAEGMQLAPAAGRIIANRLTGGSLAAYDADLRLDRVE